MSNSELFVAVPNRGSDWRGHSDMGKSAHVRAGIGVFLIVFSLYALFRPAMKPITVGGAPVDACVGFLNGVLAGISGLAGILVTLWCGLRGRPKDQQRTVFQPVAVAIFAMSAAWLGAKSVISAETIRLFLFGRFTSESGAFSVPCRRPLLIARWNVFRPQIEFHLECIAAARCDPLGRP